MEQTERDPFYKWKVWSDEELRASDLSGAKIELARRTKDVQDIECAINTLDNSTYNAFFVLTLADTDDKLHVLLHNLDTQLVPVILNRRNLSVEGNEDLFKYFMERVKDKTVGILCTLQQCLQKLSQKVVKHNSNVYSTLLSYGFKSFEIYYLNYAWLKDNVSKKVAANILVQLINAYAYDCEEFTSVQKDFLTQELQCDAAVFDKIGYTTFTKYVQSRCDIIARNDSVWYFFRELCNKGIIEPSMRTGLAIPFMESDRERFAGLSFVDKCYCLDNCITGIKDKEQLLQILEDNCMVGYTDLTNREVNLDTVDRLLKLNVLCLSDVPETLVTKYVQKYINDSVVDFLIESEEVSVLDVKDVYVTNYSRRVDLDDLFNNVSSDKVKRFIDKTVKEAYDTVYSDSYVSYVAFLLADARVRELYDKAYIKELIDYVVTNFSDDISASLEDKLRKSIYTNDEYQKYLEDKKEKERLAAEQRAKENFNYYLNNVKRYVDEIDSLADLLYYALQKVAWQESYEPARIQVIYDKACELNAEPVTVDTLELYCIFQRYNLVTVNDLQSIVSDLVKQMQEAE